MVCWLPRNYMGGARCLASHDLSCELFLGLDYGHFSCMKKDMKTILMLNLFIAPRGPQDMKFHHFIYISDFILFNECNINVFNQS